ncbi:hypothetical protein C2S51_031847 [Perilla frutescens var. frutescens]|nr:hypothetical protein C2S51_031847 [Perilla frutescens var. frutescens]
MDLDLLEKGLGYAKKKRKWVFLVGFTCYGAYKVYKKRQRLSKFFDALVSVAEMVTDSADALGIVSKDLKQFLGSDSDQIPQSLKQLSKIARSDEFSDTLTRITRASAVGILSGGYQHEHSFGADRGFSDTVMNRLFSHEGAGFASAVAGSFARNTVMALLSEWQRGSDSDDLPRWIEIACDDKCRELVGDFIRLFVSTAVTVYLDKTMNVNTYDDFFVGLTNPKHEARVRDMIASVCNGAVDTCVRTSYHVWTMNSKLNSSYSKLDEKGSIRAKLIPLQKQRLAEKNQESGLMRTVHSTLAMPGNRRFVLDMTGVVTFETVRSFLEFLLEKMAEGVKTSVDVIEQEVVEKGVEAIRYASGRSSAVTAVCLTLCLNILNSPWILTTY